MSAALLDLLRKFLGLSLCQKYNINNKIITCLITKIIFQSIFLKINFKEQQDLIARMSSADLSSYRDQHFKVETLHILEKGKFDCFAFRAPEGSRRDC